MESRVDKRDSRDLEISEKSSSAWLGVSHGAVKAVSLAWLFPDSGE